MKEQTIFTTSVALSGQAVMIDDTPPQLEPSVKATVIYGADYVQLDPSGLITLRTL